MRPLQKIIIQARVWGPPLWIPYSSMLIGATLMTMSYISELILHVRKLKEFK